MKRSLKIAVIALFGLLTLALSGTAWVVLSAPEVHRLELAPGLIDATSDNGREMLAHALAKADYERLDTEFVPQSRQAYCGVATSVTVINAMLHPQPELTQDTVFTPKVVAVKSELAVTFSGLTLGQLAGLFEAHGLRAQIIYAGHSGIDAFREIVRTNLADASAYLVVNYDRKTLKQEGSGHISPVAAYSAEKDAVLILDVAAYKYPYTWVPVAKLWDAMNTIDSESGQSRGYLLISSRVVRHAVPANDAASLAQH